MSKKIVDMNPADIIPMNMELAGLQTEFSTAIFKLAKKYDVDESDLMRMAGTTMVTASTDDFFMNVVAPMIRERVDMMEEAEG